MQSARTRLPLRELLKRVLVRLQRLAHRKLRRLSLPEVGLRVVAAHSGRVLAERLDNVRLRNNNLVTRVLVALVHCKPVMPLGYFREQKVRRDLGAAPLRAEGLAVLQDPVGRYLRAERADGVVVRHCLVARLRFVA